MASRLQRRVNNAEQGKYGNLLESFVSFGTALPSLADPKAKKDANEWKPLHEQEVYDEQGRRRLHGAFTGGFSAGYFNTVGSKEGWAPSTFKSSRGSRAADNTAKSIQDQAAQFMDDEDLAELASSRTIQTASAYSAPAQQEAYDPLMGAFNLSAPPSGPAPGATAALASLIESSNSRVGAKLMRRMGWREGQGVGPRVTLQQRKAQAVELGLKLAAEDEEDEAGGEAGKHYFAPLDRPLTLLNGVGASQDRGWGLGYKSEKAIERGRGDGLGRTAPEDDDDDPYSSYGPQPARSGTDKNKWGVVELDDVDDDDLYRSSRPSAASRARKTALPRGPAQLFHDGQPVIAGFKFDSRPTQQASTSQLPPVPPPGWQPNPSRLWADPAPAPASAAEKGKARQLDPDQRGSLLGEAQLAEPVAEVVPKSVFDYLSAKSKERLASLSHAPTTSTNSTPLANPRGGYAQPQTQPDEPLSIPQLDAVTAKAALSGFQPFSAQSASPDPIKQARYTLFLQHQASSPSAETPLPFGPRKLPSGVTQTIAELNRELDVYAKAARVFKPVSGMLASRFATGATGAMDVPKVEPGLYQPPPKPAGVDPNSATDGAEAVVVQLNPAQQAVKDGKFGPLTRKIENWKPASLVCKRFGVPDPYKGQAVDESESGPGGAWQAPTSTKNFAPANGRAGLGEALSQDSVNAMMQSAGFKRFEIPGSGAPELGEDVLGDLSRSSAPSTTDGVNANSGRRQGAAPTLEQVGLGDDERQGEELLRPKAPKEVFSAIFADSDDDESDEGGDEDDAERVVVGPSLAAQPAPEEPAPLEVSLRPEDVASYRPTFSSSRTKTESSTKKAKSAKRKVGNSALSFDIDDGEGEQELVIKPKKKKADKSSKPSLEKAVVVDDDVPMSATEPPPVAVAAEPAKAAPALAQPNAGGRARASDLF